MKKIAIGAVVGLFLILGIIGAVGSPQQETTNQASTVQSATPTSTPQAPTANKQDKSPAENVSTLEKMEVAFEGNPSKEKIKERLDRALELYGLEITEDNYNRAGSALVSLRKTSKAGVTEMEILDYMIRSYAENAKMSFSDMAGLAAVILEKNIDQ